jgi:rhamnogalacturonyl hydrolase YesR
MRLWIVALVGAVALLESVTAVAVTAASPARIHAIGPGFAGSSINVVANRRNALFTHGRDQFAAYYDARGYVVLAQRKVGTSRWTIRRTSYQGNVADAHNSISLIVDGAGYLHVAWDHHGGPLNYARSLKPVSLDLGAKQSMTGQDESRVTYPEFYLLPEGDLLSLYRDGESGNGKVILNRYRTRDQKWERVQTNLLDGQGTRSAYWGAAVDRRGGLHLAWTWRERPDVASNHDLAYAFSPDGGVTWRTITGETRSAPFTSPNSDYAARIPQRSNLMNAPAVAVDRNARPYITTYWSENQGDPPQFRIVRHDGSAWRIETATKFTNAFTLSGGGTKRTPISRAALFAQGGNQDPAMHLIYRDDAHGGRVVLLSTPKLGSGEWRERELTTDSLGAWEPVFDPVQWDRLAQFHLLVQNVTQTDGNDAQAPKVQPTPVGVLIVSPREIQIATAPRSETRTSAAPAASEPLTPDTVVATMKRVADWQIAHPPQIEPRDWIVAPMYLGFLALHRVSGDEKYRQAVLEKAEGNGWQPGPRVYHADDHAVIQSYLELYNSSHDERMLAPSRKRFDEILAHPSASTLEWNGVGALERWDWCDALFMAPTSWLMMWKATGDSRYLDFMNREWWATTDSLFYSQTGWFFRDESFIDQREPNGKTVHWSRGNGWVVAGLARVLDVLPKDHPDYPRYVELYRRMMRAALAAQQPDGMWHAGLLDPVAHPAREVTGTSFMTFALTWGVNRGLLPRQRVEPAVKKAWQALTASVQADGKLTDCQPVGDAPLGFDPQHTEPFGVGAFLLAGSEMHRLLMRNSR